MGQDYKKHILFAFIVLSILLFSYSIGTFTGKFVISPQDLPGQQCQDIASPGTFLLANGISGTQAGKNYCMRVVANNVVLDCAGNYITGNGVPGEDYGVYVVGVNTLTIKNCNINKYRTAGVYVTASSSVLISGNNVFDNNMYGIELFSASNNQIANNSVTGNGMDGVYLHSLDSIADPCINNIIRQNTINNNAQKGIHLTYASINSILLNTITNNGEGIVLESSNNNQITDNNADSNNPDFRSTLSSGNSVSNFKTGKSNLTFTYGGAVALKSAPAPLLVQPSGYKALGYYLDITGAADTWVYLNFVYNDSNVLGLKESSVRIWKYSSETWSQSINKSGVLVSGVNTALNKAYANITSFGSIFAPMGSEPLNTTVVSPENTTYKGNSLWFNATTNLNATNCTLFINKAPIGGVAFTGSYYLMTNSSSTSWGRNVSGLPELLDYAIFNCSNSDESSVKTVYFTMDSTAPIVTITHPSGSQTFNSSAVAVTATANEFSSGCIAEFDSSANVSMTNVSGVWNSSKSLGNGAHTARVYCTDVAGNIGFSSPVSFNVNVPHVTIGINITAPASNAVITSGTATVRASTNVSAQDCNAEFDSTTNSSMSYSSGNWSAAKSLSNGAHKVKVYCVVGTEDWSMSSALSFTVNYTSANTSTTPIIVTVTSPKEGIVYTEKTISVAARTTPAASNCVTSFDDSLNASMAYISGNWFVDRDMSNSKHSIKVFCSDSSNKWYASSKTTFTVNVTAQPAPPVAEPEFPIEPVLTVVCGDGICDLSESSFSCPADCEGPTDEQKGIGLGFVFVSFGLAAAAVALAIGVFFIVIKPRLGKKEFIPEEPAQQVQPSKEQMLEVYVRKNLDKGRSHQEIFDSLVKVGWTEEQIESAFELSMVPPQKQSAIVSYIERQFSSGFTAQQISQKLVSAGWKKAEVAQLVKSAQK